MDKRGKHKYNNTSNFLLPLIGFPFNVFKPYLYNGYVHDTHLGRKYPYCVYILLKFKGVKNYLSFENSLRKSPRYKTDYNVAEGQYVMFVMEVLPKYKPDYSLIIDGKYSQISEEAKTIILQGRQVVVSPTGKRSKSILTKILSKDISLKEFWEKRTDAKLNDQELWSKMDTQAEVFNTEILKGLNHGYKIKEYGQNSITDVGRPEERDIENP